MFTCNLISLFKQITACATPFFLMAHKTFDTFRYRTMALQGNEPEILWWTAVIGHTFRFDFPIFIHEMPQKLRNSSVNNDKDSSGRCDDFNAGTLWRHQMETFSALLVLDAGNSPVTGEFPAQRPVSRRFDVFFDLRLNKRLKKQSRGWWYATPWCLLWRHCNGTPVPQWHTCRQNHNKLAPISWIWNEWKWLGYIIMLKFMFFIACVCKLIMRTHMFWSFAISLNIYIYIYTYIYICLAKDLFPVANNKCLQNIFLLVLLVQ